MAPLIYHWAGGAYEKTARDLKNIYIRSDCTHSGKYDMPFQDVLRSSSAPPRSSTSLHRHRSRPARAQTRSIASVSDPMAALSPPSACRPQPNSRALSTTPPSRRVRARMLAAHWQSESVPFASSLSLGCTDVSTCSLLGGQDDLYAHARCYNLGHFP